jgi:hypothetical protein
MTTHPPPTFVIPDTTCSTPNLHPLTLSPLLPLPFNQTKGGVGVAEKEVPRPSGADWISAKAWGEICRAPHVAPQFASLPEDVSSNLQAWKSVFDSVGWRGRGAGRG